MTRRILIFFAATLALTALTGIAAFLFQDNLSRFLINPRTPFQAISPPPKPEYLDANSWALWAHDAFEETVHDEVEPEGAAPEDSEPVIRPEIFYVHSTTFDKRSAWNGALEDGEATQVLRDIALPNEIGPFALSGLIYAPRYRQATLYARFSHKYDANAARALAYGDIINAFEHYLASANPDAPLILVGYGQGALYVEGLLNDFIARNSKLRQRLTAAYLLNYDHAIIEPAAPNAIPICAEPRDTGCLIAFHPITKTQTKDIQRARARALSVMRGKIVSVTKPNLTCTNPLNWQVNGPYAAAENHLGAASASGLKLDQEPPLVSGALGAACEDGVLLIDEPEKSFLKHDVWFGKQWRAAPFNLFYADLQRDIARRLSLHGPVLSEQVRQLDPIPIEDAVDLTDSPINRVPN